MLQKVFGRKTGIFFKSPVESGFGVNPHCSPLPFNMLSIVGFKNFGWRFVYYRFLFAEGFVIDV